MPKCLFHHAWVEMLKKINKGRKNKLHLSQSKLYAQKELKKYKNLNKN
jgi:ferredoxin-fold anticodon binding domain-containing protein